MVTVAVAIPQELVYVIVPVPAAIPVTTPDIESTESKALAVLQRPPVVALKSVVEVPGHANKEPVMVLGSGNTVTMAVSQQPRLSV
jgi:hypothetical protein